MDESHSAVRRKGKCIFRLFTDGSFAISVRISEFLAAFFFSSQVNNPVITCYINYCHGTDTLNFFSVTRREILERLWCV